MGSRLYTEKGLAITNNHQQLKPCHAASKQICNCAGEQYSTQGSTRHNSLYVHSAERLYQFLLGTAQWSTHSSISESGELVNLVTETGEMIQGSWLK